MKQTVVIILIISVVFFGLSYLGWKAFEKNDGELHQAVYGQNVRDNLNGLLLKSGVPAVEEGVPIIINVWATWCGPCIMEIPDMNQVVEDNKDMRVRFLAFSDESPEKLIELRVKKPAFDFKYEMVFEAREIIQYLSNLDLQNQGQAIPIHLLIKPDGTLKETITGASESTIIRIRSFLETENHKNPAIHYSY